jgi:hypothetical protein
MKEAPGSSGTSVLTRATWRNNTEDTILHSRRRENLKSYKYFAVYVGLLGNGNVVPSSPILVTLMMEALRSSETSVLTRTIRHNIPEDSILHRALSHLMSDHMSGGTFS